MGNRLGREKANDFRLRFGTLSQHLYIINYLMKDSMLLKHLHPPQCSELLVFSAVSVRERFEENLTAKV